METQKPPMKILYVGRISEVLRQVIGVMKQAARDRRCDSMEH
jgi:hypothetical protein